MKDYKLANESRLLFEQFNITEWETKCVILSPDEKKQVLKDLTTGEYSPITKLVMLPFPTFIKEYYLRFYIDDMSFYKRIPALDKYFSKENLQSDGRIGYLLYLLPTYILKDLNTCIKFPRNDASNLFRCASKDYSFQSIAELLETSPDCYLNSPYANRETISRYIHIMSYINKEEAERLGLQNYTFYTNGEYRGFDIKEKLESLNPFIRNVIIDFIGLKGEYFNKTELLKKYEINAIASIIDDDFLNNLARSLGEFRNTIGYIDRDYRENEHREYLYKNKYNKIFTSIELSYVKRQLLAIEDQKKF